MDSEFSAQGSFGKVWRLSYYWTAGSCMEWIEAKDAAEHSSVDRSATVMVNFMCELDRPRRAQIMHSLWGGRMFLNEINF